MRVQPNAISRLTCWNRRLYQHERTIFLAHTVRKDRARILYKTTEILPQTVSPGISGNRRNFKGYLSFISNRSIGAFIWRSQQCFTMPAADRYLRSEQYNPGFWDQACSTPPPVRRSVIVRMLFPVVPVTDVGVFFEAIGFDPIGAVPHVPIPHIICGRVCAQ